MGSVAPRPAAAGKSALERAMATHLRMAGIAYAEQVRAIPGRMFSWDFEITGYRILVEVQGGVWSAGKHGRGSGILTDQEKLFLAQLHGYRVIQVSENHIRDGRALRWIQHMMEAAQAHRRDKT